MTNKKNTKTIKGECNWTVTKVVIENEELWKVEGPNFNQNLYPLNMIHNSPICSIDQAIWDQIYRFYEQTRTIIDHCVVRSDTGHLLEVEWHCGATPYASFTRGNVCFCMNYDEIRKCKWLEKESKLHLLEVIDVEEFFKANGHPKGFKK